jgi:4-hydroxythreonine-4-phosphate dehydrogenase
VDGYRLAISLGDPTGVGPEVVVRALAERPDCRVCLYGDREVLERAARITNARLSPAVEVVPVTSLDPTTIPPGKPSLASGRAQVEYLRAATKAVLAGEASGLVTAPLSKEWAARAGFAFDGHTEFLAEQARVSEFAMMLAGPRLRVTLATRHIPLAQVASSLSVESLASAVVLTANALKAMFRIPVPRVAVAGLNPHAGEAGRFGDEEIAIVTPAVALARQRLASVGVAAHITGPHVPDAVFREATEGAFDAVVALYHDQGLIPIKMTHFEEAVNVTLGLPFVRTSPDHGTAYDIAGTGRARAGSFLAALDLAAELVSES